MPLAHPNPKPEKRAPRPPKRIARGKRPARTTRVTKQRTTEKARQRRRDDAWWSGAVRRRAEFLCERSGTLGEAGHHVWPKKAHPKLRHVIDNGIFLTREEHDRAHKNMRAFRTWFATRFPERWARLEAARLG